MIRDIVVVGAGGFGRETLDVVDAINRAGDVPTIRVIGVVDSSPSEANQARLAARGVDWLGTVDEWIRGGFTAQYVIAVGNPSVRWRLSEQFELAGGSALTLVHPSAQVGTQVEIGVGSVICGGAQISTNVKIGRHAHINPSATIGHDTVLGDFTSINPGAVVSGDVVGGCGVLVGAGAVVLQGLRLGNTSVVGAAACVVRDVAQASTVKGVPAR
jgi:sugar O-acyltransferase (sialic acid O-acetyltransferase NeuD family)